MEEERSEAMFLLKSCPRCQGDLALDYDSRTAFLYCVQCGHVLSVAQERALGVRATRNGLIHTAAFRYEPVAQQRELVGAGAR
jgi:hypothetical protein